MTRVTGGDAVVQWMILDSDSLLWSLAPEQISLEGSAVKKLDYIMFNVYIILVRHTCLHLDST